MQERGWLSWNFYPTIQDSESSKYFNIVKSIIILRRDYIDFPVALPSIVQAQRYQMTENVRLALSQIFCYLPDFVFYDFITIYENIALDKLQQQDFIADLDNYFQQLGVNMTFANNQIIPRQSKEIQRKIIEPTIHILNSETYFQINQELSYGYGAYIKKDYDKFILCSINALISTLELLTYGEITKKTRTFDKMVQKLKLSGSLSSEITDLLKSINTYIEIERRDKTKAHTSNKKPTSYDSIFIFNLVMSTIQFIIISQKNKPQEFSSNERYFEKQRKPLVNIHP